MKKTQQITKKGNIRLDYDQKMTPNGLKDHIISLFGQGAKRDRGQVIVFGKVCMLIANVTYLGHPHPLYKKRIQLKTYYPNYCKSNSDKGNATIYLGVYSYKKQKLYVVFDPSTYLTKKSHNSAAHVFSTDLAYAARTGFYEKNDSNGNNVKVFDKPHFITYVKSLSRSLHNNFQYDDVASIVKDYLSSFFGEMPTKWNGVDAYSEMDAANFTNKRHNRWTGWYFEFLMQQYFEKHPTDDVVWNADKTKKGIDFDLMFPKFVNTYGDVKMDILDEDILGNDFNAFEEVFKKPEGVVYYICGCYKGEYDKDYDYVVTKKWNTIRETEKQYKSEEELINGFGRYMRYSADIQSINLIRIDPDVYEILKQKPFTQGRNSNGRSRAAKLMIAKDMINALSIYTYVFGEKNEI